MKTVLFFICFVGIFQLTSQQPTKEVMGAVTHQGQPLENVSIINKRIKNGVMTNIRGAYAIQVVPKDVLVFSHLGMKSVEVIIEDVTTTLNIDMIADVEVLNEVVVSKKKNMNQQNWRDEYALNKDLISTSWGIVNQRTFTSSLRVIDKDDFNAGATDFISAILGRFIGRPGVDSAGVRTIYLRASGFGNNLGALYDIDGVITHDSPVYLAVDDIERIAIMKGPAAVSRYGGRGAGGVIIINTKIMNRNKIKGTKKVNNLADSRAEFVEKEFLDAPSKVESPSYLKLLSNSKTQEEAKLSYKAQKSIYGKSAYFYIDTGNYFINTWKNAAIAEEIWSNVKDDFSTNAVELKALAYTYEANGLFDQALMVYQKIGSLRPDYAQSYRDLANVYIELGNTERALNLYRGYVAKYKNEINIESAKGIDFIMNVEAMHIVSTSNYKGNTQVNPLEKVIGHSAIRVLLEWNNGEAEFDIPFLSKENEYFEWGHTYNNNAGQIKDEKTRGYSSTQIFIEDYSSDDWQFNLKYYGNKSLDPTYFKTTIYYDYGRPSQRKEIKVFRITGDQKNIRLFNLKTGHKISLN